MSEENGNQLALPGTKFRHQTLPNQSERIQLEACKEEHN